MNWNRVADRVLIVCGAFIVVVLGLGLLATYAPGALQVIAGIAVICAGIAVYLAPAIAARYRGVPNAGSVAVVNVLLGWTVIGWIVALAMAMRDPQPPGPGS